MNRFVIALLSGVAGLALVSGAHAADLIIDEPAAGVVEVAGGNWDGVYVGAFVGGLAGTFSEENTNNEIDISGWLAGVNLGVNFTVADGIVLGVVGDVAWTNAENDVDPFSVDWTGSLRGRVGFDGGAFLPYLTAGLAVAGGEIGGSNETHVGWTVGAGVEFAVADNISVDLLYRYSDYGNVDYGYANDFSLTSHAVTVGLNFKF
ncbi:MAG TPA: outer membrane protein [Devosia sp.]|jgi:outer membrane immunogenic protein|uniref:outer membrane protein n=1 Tax=Devosia sp. TaxID=1871048 RepID=UPI002DDD3EB7|nr:outer membrane protein [Devosia sp.]HEV2515363.1 outer membrane protein [Devosia sp.]